MQYSVVNIMSNNTRSVLIFILCVIAIIIVVAVIAVLVYARRKGKKILPKKDVESGSDSEYSYSSYSEYSGSSSSESDI